MATFLDYLTYPYMIDNLILLITGTLHHRDISELIDKCHPLGLFDSMTSLVIASNPEELYREIVVDTPLAPYFAECVSLEDLTDVNIEIIRNTLYKAYLEDFHRLCMKLGGATAELMSEILKFEADRRAINITVNSFGTELTKDEREKLYPTIGTLFPEGIFRLSRADEVQAVASAIDPYVTYRKLFQSAADSSDKSLEDCFFEHEVFLCQQTFEKQFHYAIFYAYLRLKEQEVRNILWICEVRSFSSILYKRKSKQLNDKLLYLSYILQNSNCLHFYFVQCIFKHFCFLLSQCISQKQMRKINNFVTSAFS